MNVAEKRLIARALPERYPGLLTVPAKCGTGPTRPVPVPMPGDGPDYGKAEGKITNSKN